MENYKIIHDAILNADTGVLRLSDKASIPFDPANVDYQKYLEWISQGNQPEQPDA
jgi:hypothetical protein